MNVNTRRKRMADDLRELANEIEAGRYYDVGIDVTNHVREGIGMPPHGWVNMGKTVTITLSPKILVEEEVS